MNRESEGKIGQGKIPAGAKGGGRKIIPGLTTGATKTSSRKIEKNEARAIRGGKKKLGRRKKRSSWLNQGGASRKKGIH